MAITKKEIEHIADLARLELSTEEKEKYRLELSSILDYVSQLQELDTEGLEITAQVSGLNDVWREDQVKDWDRDELAQALQSGELEGGQIKVKRVL